MENNSEQTSYHQLNIAGKLVLNTTDKITLLFCIV